MGLGTNVIQYIALVTVYMRSYEDNFMSDFKDNNIVWGIPFT